MNDPREEIESLRKQLTEMRNGVDELNEEILVREILVRETILSAYSV